jgi:5-hydroxyisourate hydrolase-like protein (transthyretin family)
MSILKKHVAHPVALLAAIATLASGLTCMTNPVASPKAHADELKPAYATAKIVKKADGTGHGTSSQTFVNSKNGFATGDDSPTDGVVASGDTVEYSLTLNFNAAGKRTINVKFDLDDAPYLQTADGGGFCQPGQLVTAKKNSDGSCSYTVPAGGVETMTQTFYLKAKDTGGLVKPGQIPKIVVAREGGTSTTYRTDELTVVSAPAADLVIDNGGNPVKGQYSYEHRTYWSQNTDATGDFTIRADALTYPGYSSTKGASTSIDWTTKVDISDFPQGTVWTVGGQRITRNSDKEQYLTVSSGKNGAAATISYRIPAGTDALKNMKEGDVKYYDVHLVPDETVFSVKDDNGDALLNMGKGGEPGWNIGRDKSTYNKDTGARVGYPYANNDWSRAIIQRLKPTPAGKIPLFGKGLQRPNTASKTMFDKENLTFDAAEGKADIYHYYSDGSGDTVSRGTQVKTILEMYAANVTADKLKNTTPTMQDEWDNTRMRWDGSLEVTQNGAPVSDYKVQWADSKDNWHDGEPSDTDAPNVKKIRVTFNPDTLTLGKGAPNVQVTFNTLAIADVSKGNVEALDTLTAWLTEDDKASVTNWVWIAKPVDPTTSIDISLKAYDGEGNQVYANNSSNHPSGSAVDLTPGMRVDYTVTEQLRTILLSNTSMTPTITVPKPKGLYNPTCDDSFWQMKVDGNNLVFTPRSGKVTPEVDRMGSATLPDLHFSGIVSNLATGTVTASANMSVDVDENGALQAQTIKSNTPSVPFPVSNAETNSGIMRVKTTKAEISDPLTWEFNVYGKGGGHTGTMDSMLLLPANGDEKYVQDKLVEYERGYSNYHGSYELTQPVTVNMDNSTSTTVYYSTTTGKKSDNPADYEWKTWDELSAIEKKNITAIRLTSTVVASDDKLSYSAVNGTITLTPSDNVKDDKYTLWLGRNYYSDASDKPAGNQPWPDVAKVVAGSISGTVWWDKDENTLIGDSEEHIEGVEVTLGKQNSSGGWQTVKTVKTDKDGHYEFDLLHSGTYRTSVKRNTGTSTGDGVQTQVKTYYNKLENVTNTRSWSNKIKSNAKDTSDDIHLGIGADQKNVDYGYAKPDPKATVDKTVTGTSCTDTKCVVNWDVKVQNKGTSRFDTSSVVSDRMSADVHDVSATAGTVSIESGGAKQVATSGDHKFVLTSEGLLYAWGNNQYGQLGFKPDSTNTSTPVNVNKPTMVNGSWLKVAAGGKHSAAISTDGHLYTTGWNGKGQLGTGDTDNRFEWTEVASDKTFTDVACGNQFTVAIASDGTLWGVGNAVGSQNYAAWTQIGSGVKFTQLSASMEGFIALNTSGGYLYSGTGVSLGQLSSGGYTQVAAAFGQMYALKDDGTVFWFSTYSTTLSGLKDIVKISGGYNTLYAIDKNQHLWASGWNGDGQLANGKTGNGMYWTDGSTGNNTDVIGTPVDTGIIASDVAGGDRDVLILGKQVMIAGFDPYGDGKTGGARSTGLKGMAVSSDPTAVPVEPSSETTENGLTTRTYNLPYAIEPGGYVIYHFTGTVDRETADMTGKDQSYIDEWVKKNTKTILNQAWFDSEHTPYSGTPHAIGKNKPNTPDATKLDANTNDVTGNPTCRTDTDYTEEGRQHWFSTSDEDSCDQVGTIITPTTTAKKLGSISGLYWEDTNKNGIQDEGENTHFAGQTVILTDENGKQLATTKTDKDGKYIFERLDANGNKYRIQFTKVNHRDFTTPDVGDKTPAADGSSTDSDAYTDEANKLTITLTQDAPTKEHVDAGVLPETWLATMPHTGMGLLLPLLMLVSISGLVAAIILLRKKEEQ